MAICASKVICASKTKLPNANARRGWARLELTEPLIDNFIIRLLGESRQCGKRRARKRRRIPCEQKFLSYMAFSVHEVVLSLKRTARLTSDANDFVNAKSHAREQERKTSAHRVEEGRPYNKKQENKTTAGSGYTRLNSGDVLLLLSLRCSSKEGERCVTSKKRLRGRLALQAPGSVVFWLFFYRALGERGKGREGACSEAPSFPFSRSLTVRGIHHSLS